MRSFDTPDQALCEPLQAGLVERFRCSLRAYLLDAGDPGGLFRGERLVAVGSPCCYRQPGYLAEIVRKRRSGG